MTDNVYLNKDKTAVVPKSALGKKWQVPRKEAVRLGLLDSPEKPTQARRTADPEKPKTPQRRRSAGKQGQNRGLNQDA